MSATFYLPNGNVVELYEPPSSGHEPMMRGRCPGCNEVTTGFVGRYGCVRELDHEFRPILGSGYATSYGHLDCVWHIFNEAQLAAGRTVDDADGFWYVGRQRDVIDFVKKHVDRVVEVRLASDRRRTERYDYRLRIKL